MRIPVEKACPRGDRGVALVIVLVALVLVSVLVLAFLSGVGSELQSSKMYADGSSVKLLAQSSVALVQAEIQAATADPKLCWASQPGMIRTYDATGAPNGYYKLYSDDAMGGTGRFDHTVPGLVPDGSGGSIPWYNQKGVYVDLNQPIFFNNTDYYPIIDGNASHYGNGYTTPLASKTVPAATSTVSSLLPLGSNNLPSVTGFWLNSNAPVDSTSPNVAPMPVKWLYVLKNGEIIVPDSGPLGGRVTFKNVPTQPVPTADDPIVGRIAFWTDDETCKVNVNTASEGSFWDTPRAYTKGELALATSQPVQDEFQRYPGHPATVSLSAVFNDLATQPASVFPENIYPLTPRIQGGGSKGGTQLVSNVLQPLTMRTTRLYSTPDEFLFQPTISGSPGTGARDLNSALVAASSAIDATALTKANFFLTASSTAPDVNIFNLPRVSMWPITLTGGSAGSATPATTPFDKLIAFCTTISGNKYYFSRWDSTSPSNDLPTTATGPGALPRNRTLLEYLRTLVSRSAITGAPGFGGGLLGQYLPADQDQILTEAFDYIRCTNLQDTSTGATIYVKTMNGTGAYSGGGLGQVTPIMDTTISINDPVGGRPNNPRGFGRFPTIQQAAMVFIGAGDNMTDPGSPSNPSTSYLPRVAQGFQRVQAGLFLQMFNPAEGVAITRPWYKIKIPNLQNLQWNGAAIFSNTAAASTLQPMAADGLGNIPQGFSYGGLEDFRQMWQGRDLARGSGSSAVPVYPFISVPTGQTGTTPDFPMAKVHPLDPYDPVTNPYTTGAFVFTGGTISAEIYALDAAGNTVGAPVQTVSLTFPVTLSCPVPFSIDNNVTTVPPGPYTPVYYNVPTDIPAPTTPYSAATYLPNTGGTGAWAPTDPTLYNFLSFTGKAGRKSRLGFLTNSSWLTTCDVVRAVVATPGDMRLVAARQFVPDALFKPITGGDMPASADYYGGISAPFSHMLRFNTSTPYYGSIGGRLIYSPVGRGDDTSDQYFKNPSTGNKVDLGSSTYTSGGGSGLRPKDNQVPNLKSSVTITGTSIPGDWDNGFQNSSDGPYINKPDEGDAGQMSTTIPGTFVGNGNPYFELDYAAQLPGPTFFSPNRMIPSSGMFGSLPTGVWANKAWQTLLFRPGPAGHPGLGSGSGSTGSGSTYSNAPDHLFLDLFNMPVVEPYAISTPLATAGRINMNYLVVPFTYINRDTGLRAALKSQMITAITSGGSTLSNSGQYGYKSHTNAAGAYQGNSSTLNIRWPINLDSTLSQFLARFYNISSSQGSNGAPDIFHSASEICDIDLVPTDMTGATTSLLTIPITRANMDIYWSKSALTGDNSRERPYANIYPLLTTKSNTFTVHFRVQALKQALTAAAGASDWNSWREGKDVVTSEYRGSQTIERYVDPNAPIPDYAATVVANNTVTPPSPLSGFYKFRVVSSKQFPP